MAASARSSMRTDRLARRRARPDGPRVLRETARNSLCGPSARAVRGQLDADGPPVGMDMGVCSHIRSGIRAAAGQPSLTPPNRPPSAGRHRPPSRSLPPSPGRRRFRRVALRPPFPRPAAALPHAAAALPRPAAALPRPAANPPHQPAGPATALPCCDPPTVPALGYPARAAAPSESLTTGMAVIRVGVRARLTGTRPTAPGLRPGP